MNKYVTVTIFLLALGFGGGIYILSNKSSNQNQPLQTENPSATIEPTLEPMEDKLIIVDEKIGTGAEATAGKKITVNYSGTLTNGTKFDSSYDRGTPFSFTLGAGEVIQGWDQGIVGMKVGGKRKLTIPPSLGYGSADYGPIPGNSTLIFEVELLGVE